MHKDRNNSDNKEDNSESAESRLGGGKSPPQSKSGSKDEEKRKRTARVFQKKFRSVFDEDEKPLPVIKKRTPEELKAGISIQKKNR